MEFFRQEHWSGLPFPFPVYLPNVGIEPGSPALQGGSLSSEPTGKLCFHILAIVKSAVMDTVLLKQRTLTSAQYFARGNRAGKWNIS